MVLVVLYLLLYIASPCTCQVDGRKATKLKAELLDNLNKYSEKGLDALEALSSPSDSSTENPSKNGQRVPSPSQWTPNPVPPPPPPPPAFPGLDLLNLFRPQPPSILSGIPNLFNGMLPLQTTPAPLSSLNIQPIPFGGRQKFRRVQEESSWTSTRTTMSPFITFPPLFPQSLVNGVSHGEGLNETPFEPPPSASVSAVDGTATAATAAPRYRNHSSTEAPVPPEEPPTNALTDEVVNNIKDWRQRFYKAFKKLSQKHTHPTTTTPPLARPRYSGRMQPVVVLDDTRAPLIDKNLQVLQSRRHPNWTTSQKVKMYARDSKGRVVRLFGVESSGYNYSVPNANSNGFLPRNPDPGPVYIPAARPTTELPPYYPQTTPAPVLDNYVAPVAPPPPPANTYTVAMPAPVPAPAPTYIMASYPSSTYRPPPTDPELTNEVDGLDYESNDAPCTAGCQQNQDQYGMLENSEKCNSLRLRYIIQESIVNSDAEASKRAIQTRAELELNSFFNVVCGTGFFSYIAHTDEFCQASALGINCYVFSPVCSLRMEMGSGVVKNRKTARRKKTRAVAVVNRN